MTLTKLPLFSTRHCYSPMFVFFFFVLRLLLFVFQLCFNSIFSSIVVIIHKLYFSYYMFYQIFSPLPLSLIVFHIDLFLFVLMHTSPFLTFNLSGKISVFSSRRISGFKSFNFPPDYFNKFNSITVVDVYYEISTTD